MTHVNGNYNECESYDDWSYNRQNSYFRTNWCSYYVEENFTLKRITGYEQVVYLKKFVISGTVFDGWETVVDLDEIDSIEELVAIVKKEISRWIKTNYFTLRSLQEVIDNLTLYINDSFTSTFSLF